MDGMCYVFSGAFFEGARDYNRHQNISWIHCLNNFFPFDCLEIVKIDFLLTCRRRQWNPSWHDCTQVGYEYTFSVNPLKHSALLIFCKSHTTVDIRVADKTNYWSNRIENINPLLIIKRKLDNRGRTITESSKNLWKAMTTHGSWRDIFR